MALRDVIAAFLVELLLHILKKKINIRRSNRLNLLLNIIAESKLFGLHTKNILGLGGLVSI